jgi:hypothetical protein
MAARVDTYRRVEDVPKAVLDWVAGAYAVAFAQPPWKERWGPKAVLEKLRRELAAPAAFLTIMHGDSVDPIAGFCWGALVPRAALAARVCEARRGIDAAAGHALFDSSELRLGADAAHTNIAVPSEGSVERNTGFFGADARLLPDAWNPLSGLIRLYAIGGAGTGGGWGTGAGLYGNGPLQFLSCNPAYSSRPQAQSLGRRVNVWSATCSVVVPL